MPSYRLEQFEGPLDLLLQMIQREELDITEISLAAVAEQFVVYIKENPDGITGEEMADFLVVATQLLLLKSQLLLPDLEVEDDVDPDSLATQLKLYRKFVHAAQLLQTRIDQKSFLFAQPKSRHHLQTRFSPPPSLSLETMQTIMREVISRLEPVVILPESIMEKTVTLHEKITQIQELLKRSKGVSFKQILKQSRSKIEQIVSFLALLELVKQEEIEVRQSSAFEDILIDRTS